MQIVSSVQFDSMECRILGAAHAVSGAVEPGAQPPPGEQALRQAAGGRILSYAGLADVAVWLARLRAVCMEQADVAYWVPRETAPPIAPGFNLVELLAETRAQQVNTVQAALMLVRQALDTRDDVVMETEAPPEPEHTADDLTVPSELPERLPGESELDFSIRMGRLQARESERRRTEADARHASTPALDKAAAVWG